MKSGYLEHRFSVYNILENNFQTKYFVADVTANMQFNKRQNRIYGSLITIQYHM